MRNFFTNKPKKHFRRTFKVLVKIPAKILIGEFKKRKKHYKKRKRTLHTYNNKLSKLKSRYNKLSKGEKFKSKYPTLDSFIKIIKLKEVS